MSLAKKKKRVTHDYRHMWPVLLCRCLRCVSCQGFPGYKKTDFFFGDFWGGGESDGLKWCPHKVISAQCPECQSGANSNKRGCGPPVKAQATARVDVPTARVFPAWSKESNTSASFCCERLDTCTAGNRP